MRSAHSSNPGPGPGQYSVMMSLPLAGERESRISAASEQGSTMTDVSTADPTAEFFRGLVEQGHHPLLATTQGTLRFDLVDDDHDRVERWFVTVSKGDVTVSHKNAKADAVARTDRALFDRISSGTENAMAALLRGALLPEGDIALLLSFQRVFPGPSRSTGDVSAPSARGAR